MQLQKGQKIKLADVTASRQINLNVQVGMKTGTADVTCFGVDAQGKLSDDRYFVFYNQKHTPENAITMNAEGTRTRFSIDLQKLPSFIKKLVVTVAADGDVTMRDIQRGTLSLSADRQEAASFSFAGGDFTQEKALILCELYEKDGIWRMSVVASGFNGGLSALLAHFGGEEIKSPAPASSPASKPKPAKPAPAAKQAAPAPVSPAPPRPTKINLVKSGDTHHINLQKNSGEIHANLNWSVGRRGLFGTRANIDLDLACLYRLKTGETGVVQALGKAFGYKTKPPYIRLDQDDRTGASVNGENMVFRKPETIDFAVIFAYIYEGTSNWNATDATVVLKQSGSPDIEIHIQNSSNRDRFCVIASLSGRNGQLEVKREERFFTGHKEIDRYYHFGLRWTPGSK
ncbi:TerD family protein [Anaeromassilibacillus senegalensis]|uniref:TerD family protein n=1 Tax=Anaeromassilibacillus senegalensis TaxID=1673717 RepID=UPI0006800960|nr:TerD family protein [Anaeromassilibacillus senegalensis]